MYDEVSHADLRTLFEGNLVAYQGRPIKVRAISAAGSLQALDLEDQKLVTITKNKLVHLTPIFQRLGMVNFDGYAVFLQRDPVRKYGLGANTNNVTCMLPDIDGYPRGIRERLLALDSMAVFECLSNIYPTLKEAIATVKEFGRSCAFDKQFAVDRHMRVHYKYKCVGSVNRDAKNKTDIIFEQGFSHLVYALGETNAKNLSETRARLCA